MLLTFKTGFRFSRLVIPIQEKLKLKKKKHSDLNKLKKQLQLTRLHKANNPNSIYEEIPHREVYRRMDSSVDSFFLKREYTLNNFNFLLNILAEQQNTDKIPAVLDKMAFLKMLPDETSYNYMVKAAANKGDVQLAQKFFKEFKEKFPVNNHTYTSLMMAYVRTGDSDMAQRILLEMEQNGLVADIAVLTTLMNAHLKSRRLEKCWELHRHIQRQGVIMDQTYISVLMQVYASSHDTEKAIKLYREHIESSDSQPLTETMNAYLKALSVRSDYAQQGVDIFFRLVDQGSLINASTILYALRACAQLSDMKSASEVVKVMKNKQIEPTRYIYNAMIRCYATACAIPNLDIQTMDLFITDSWKLLQQISRKGMLDVKILNNFLSMYVYALRGEEIDGLVLPLYDKHHIQKDQYTYEYLLKLFDKKQDMATFTRIWNIQKQYLKDKSDKYLREHGSQRQADLIKQHDFRPTFNSICMYLESGIKLMDMNRIIEALTMLKHMKRMPKTKHLKFLGQLKDLPVEIQAELIDFKMQFGAIRGKRRQAPAVEDPQNIE